MDEMNLQTAWCLRPGAPRTMRTSDPWLEPWPGPEATLMVPAAKAHAVAGTAE